MAKIPHEPMDAVFDMIWKEMEGKFAKIEKKKRPSKADLNELKEYCEFLIEQIKAKIKKIWEVYMQEKGPEREFETGKDEAYWAAGYDQTRSWNANTKATYDMWVNEWSKINSHYHEAMIQARRHAEDLHTAAMRHVENSRETDNMTGKQAVKHADVAADSLWTSWQELLLGRTVSGDEVYRNAVAAAMIAFLTAQGFKVQPVNKQ